MRRLVFLIAMAAAALLLVGAAAVTSAQASNEEENGVFLCYSAWQVEPGVWPESTAATLVKAGYWQPFAVKGFKEGGTNIGDYHLVCNLLVGQSMPDKHGYVGAGGTLLETDMHDQYASILGWYPLVK